VLELRSMRSIYAVDERGMLVRRWCFRLSPEMLRVVDWRLHPQPCVDVTPLRTV
jgi:hypothetical protein